MKLDLLELGYTIRDINSFTPLRAHEIISQKITITRSESERETESERESTDRDAGGRSADTTHSNNHGLLAVTELSSNHHDNLRQRSLKIPSNHHENLRQQLASINRIQSGLGDVKLKVNSSLASIDTANEAISAALDQIQK